MAHITLHLRVIGPRDRAVELVRNLEHSGDFCSPASWARTAESQRGPGERLEPVSASNRFNFDLLANYNPAHARGSKSSRQTEKSAAGRRAISCGKAEMP